MAASAKRPPLSDPVVGQGRTFSFGFGQAGPQCTDTPPELVEAEFVKQVLQVDDASDTSVLLDSLIGKAMSLGIPVSRPTTSRTVHNLANETWTCAESGIRLETSHVRTGSTGSEATSSTTLTSSSSSDGQHHHVQYRRESRLYVSGTATSIFGRELTRAMSRSLTFALYDKYLAQINPNLDQPKFPTLQPDQAMQRPGDASSGSRGYLSLKNGLLKMRRRKTNKGRPKAPTICCIACREDIPAEQTAEKLPCGHSYCGRCLRIMIQQSSSDESKMPPRCCTQPVPSNIVKSVLSREEQNMFLKAVRQYSTPWEARVFCSNPACGEFVPPGNRVDPKFPFQATCRKCRNKVCVMCKKDAHPLGQDCPHDYELEAVLKIGEKSGWRRCYKCRTLVELTQGCTHMTCRCRAQFCYICGAVWDPTVGCPNFCNGDAELERRRLEEERVAAASEAEEWAKQEAAAKEAQERAAADERTQSSPEFQALRQEQWQEMERFREFEMQTKWRMWSRHAEQKLTLVEKQAALTAKMQERHGKTSATLEDRQVVAEMELRSTLEQSERNVRTRLKHMEAYCDGMGQQVDDKAPSRVVTERDLRELGQQYSVEKNMKQLHQAKINVLRDKQAKALEALIDRQERELERLTEKNRNEVEHVESVFADEEDALATTFTQRRATMEKRWGISMEILRKELERDRGLSYSVLPPLRWPREDSSPEVVASERRGEERRGEERKGTEV